MQEFITYKTSSPSGDLISFLSGIRQLWKDTGKKGIVYHRLNMIGGTYEGAEQPYGNEEGLPVCFNQYCFDMMRPLMLSQEYIEDYIIFNGQEYEIDFDKVRMEVFTNQPKGSLNRWPAYVFPQMNTNLSDIWVDTPRGKRCADKIVINFTQRNRNYFIHYNFLKEHKEYLIFAGLQKEKDLFCSQWDLDIPLLQVDNFYELAKELNGCRFLLGNQSFCMQLCESTKVPRILEAFPMMPTHVPVGEHSYDFYHQMAVEFYFKKLLKL